MASAEAQVLAKTITFIMIAGLAFLIGRGGVTAATVGDLGGVDANIGIAVLAVMIAAGALAYLTHQRTTER